MKMKMKIKLYLHINTNFPFPLANGTSNGVTPFTTKSQFSFDTPSAIL